MDRQGTTAYSAGRIDRDWASRSCDGWPPRDVFDTGLPVDAEARWPTCPEPVRVVVYDHEHDTYSGFCEGHNGERRRFAR
jgi:hypothetical protein